MEGISCTGMDLGVDIMILVGLRGVSILSGELLAYKRDKKSAEVTRGFCCDDWTDPDAEEYACDYRPASRSS